MLLSSKGVVQESVFQANLEKFTKNYGNHHSVSNKNSYGMPQGHFKPSQWNFHMFLKGGGVAQKSSNLQV